MVPKTIVIAILLCAVAGVAFADDRTSPASLDNTAVLLVKPVAGQVVYELDGEAVPNGQLLDRLGASFGKAGGKKLRILVNQDAKFTDLFSALATAGKVGFTDIRVYCYDRQRRGMSEITIGQEQPYSAAP